MDGIIPLAPSLDHVGFFTADVEGAGLAASILVENWEPKSDNEPIICGVPKGPYLEKASAEGLKHFYGICEILVEAGIQVKDIRALKNFEKIVENHDNLCDAEFASVHRQWFQEYSDLYSQGNREAILRGQNVDSDTLEKCRVHRDTLRNELLNTMEEHHLTAFLAPAATGPAPKGLESTGDWVMNLPWTQAGLPVVTPPSGVSKDGLPMGLQVIGRWMEDENITALQEPVWLQRI